MNIHLLELENMPIFEQLHLEEALLREDDRNFCLFNYGSTPAIVMGISGKPEQLIDTEKANLLQLPLIKRFSGGGTVVIDANTLFVTFICNRKDVTFAAYPEKIMKWSETLLRSSLQIPDFSLTDNDFTIGSLKCGGNAQYIKKDRFLQHTSFLWDYKPEYMKTLLYPRKTPAYRKGRGHAEFLCTLRSHFDYKTDFFAAIKDSLKNNFNLNVTSLNSLEFPKQGRRQTAFLELSSV